MRIAPPPRRAVITGIGAVTSLGTGWKDNWRALLGGKSGIRRISLFDPKEYRSQIAAEVSGFDPRATMSEKLVDGTERFCQFAVGAAGQALEDSGYRIAEGAREVGILLGCGIGGMRYFEEQAGIYGRKGPRFIRPSSVPRIMPNAAASHIGAHWKIRGPSQTISTACSSSNHAVGQAMDWIRAGRCRAVLCGGTEALISPITFGAFDALRVMSSRNDDPTGSCRPFAKDRDGFVMGEGSVVFVLEERESAHARGATIYAEVAGYGGSSGTYNILAPEPDGLEASESMQAALADAGLTADLVEYIHAHGTATANNDLTETLAIKRTFGARASRMPISSTKAATGHMLGAAGAMGILASALAIKTGEIPPTLNYQVPDPACDLDYVPLKSRKASVGVALSNAFAFGSNNATVVIKQEDL